MLIAVGGIHGNEPAGAIAAGRVLPRLEEIKERLRGDVILLAGNTRALERGERFVDVDLNRHWTAKRLVSLRAWRRTDDSLSEDHDQRELFGDICSALGCRRGPAALIDLHTSSAESSPFATIGDTLRNRAFASHFPVPIVLGLEEQLDGTLLEVVTNAGLVTMGFEAGQHDDPVSIENAVAAIWLALVALGCVSPKDVPDLAARREKLASAGPGQSFVEVLYRHGLRPGDEFEMAPGFENFHPIRRGQRLARDWRGEVRAPSSGLILLPLYQKSGDDGFFVARGIRPFWMAASRVARRAGLDRAMALLPGVRRNLADESQLLVNTRVARFFPLQIFHVLGFRKRRWVDDLLVVSRRRFDTEAPDRYDLSCEAG